MAKRALKGMIVFENNYLKEYNMGKEEASLGARCEKNGRRNKLNET